MLKKTYNKSGRTCRVTFELPAEAEAKSACLVGEFNDWDPNAHPMKKRKDGRLSTTVTLEAGREYRFRYWLGSGRWENDWDADAYVPNPFGGEDSVVEIPAA